MTGRLTMRWYDHKAYTVCVDQVKTAAFIIATHSGWELRVRPDGPLDPGSGYVRWFAKLADARVWLNTDEGRAWLTALPSGQTAEVA